MTALSFGIHTGLPPLLHEVFQVVEEIACAAALIVVFVLNYFLQRFYVYQARQGCARKQLLLFLASSILFRGLEYIAFLIVFNIFGVQYLLAYIGVLCCSFIIKFFFYGRYVFQEPPSTTQK
jgi:putative flippase GtrA